MKKVYSNLAVIKSTVSIFNNTRKNGKQWTDSTWACTIPIGL